MQKSDDGTGDKYEDFPDDEPGHPLEPDACFKIASELKEIGNKVFKAGDLERGVEKYQKALRYLNEAPLPIEGATPEFVKSLQGLRFTLHSNSALLQTKQR